MSFASEPWPEKEKGASTSWFGEGKEKKGKGTLDGGGTNRLASPENEKGTFISNNGRGGKKKRSAKRKGKREEAPHHFYGGKTKEGFISLQRGKVHGMGLEKPRRSVRRLLADVDGRKKSRRGNHSPKKERKKKTSWGEGQGKIGLVLPEKKLLRHLHSGGGEKKGGEGGEVEMASSCLDTKKEKERVTFS